MKRWLYRSLIITFLAISWRMGLLGNLMNQNPMDDAFISNQSSPSYTPRGRTARKNLKYNNAGSGRVNQVSRRQARPVKQRPGEPLVIMIPMALPEGDFSYSIEELQDSSQSNSMVPRENYNVPYNRSHMKNELVRPVMIPLASDHNSAYKNCTSRYQKNIVDKSKNNNLAAKASQSVTADRRRSRFQGADQRAVVNVKCVAQPKVKRESVVSTSKVKQEKVSIVVDKSVSPLIRQDRRRKCVIIPGEDRGAADITDTAFDQVMRAMSAAMQCLRESKDAFIEKHVLQLDNKVSEINNTILRCKINKQYRPSRHGKVIERESIGCVKK